VEADAVQFRATVIGSTARWNQVNNRDLQAGSFFDDAQVSTSARVVVVGPLVATTLFGNDPVTALNRTVRIHQQTFRIIGVMQPYGEEADKSAIMPLNTARRYVVGGGDALNQIIVQAAGVATVPAAQDAVIRVLDDRHRIKDPGQRDFEVQSLGSRLETVNQVLHILTLFTVSVAAISLVVGGIGVLNIMLVSVTERTREIGIRKALGATRRAILQQFLIESTMLGSIGGLIGVTLGIGLSALSAALAPFLGPTFSDFTPVVSAPSVIISFSVSLAIGLIAGGYPSYRAARLRPVEALRYE
jgi:putative ABC transport system permease protein